MLAKHEPEETVTGEFTTFMVSKKKSRIETLLRSSNLLQCETAAGLPDAC